MARKGGTQRQPDLPARQVANDWKLRLIDGLTVILRRLIKYGALVLIARYGFLSIQALAGRQTGASIALQVLANVTFSKGVAWATAAGGVAYGEAQRRLKKKVIRSRANRIQELEEMIDPQRSSSALMSDGSTRPEDKEE